MNRSVLLLSNAYWPSIGGIENSLRHLAKEAQTAGDEVSILVSDLCVPEDEPQRWSTIIDGVPVRRYPIAPFASGWLKPLNLIVSNYQLWSMLRAYRRQHPDATLIARFHFSVLMAHWAGFKNVRYLVPSIISNQYRCEGTIGFLSRLKQRAFIAVHYWVQRRALQLSKNYVFSRTMEAQCALLSGEKQGHYVLTKPGVDEARFHATEPQQKVCLRERLGLPNDGRPIALFVGRYVRAKGVDLLLEAMSHIDQPLHLVLVGAGTEQSNYDETVQRLGLTDRVNMIPPTRTVEEYYAAADFFVMSSRYEPLGQTILEAFASDLPVVAFRAGQYGAEVVDTATGELGMDAFVVYASEPTALSLSVALQTMSGRLAQWIPGEIAATAHRKFSWKHLYHTLLE